MKCSVASGRRTARTRRCTHGIGEGFLGGAMVNVTFWVRLCGRVPVGWCLFETRVVLAIALESD